MARLGEYEAIINLEKIAYKLSKKYNLEVHEIRKIFNSPFAFVKQCIKSKDYVNIYIPFLGSFQPKLRFKYEKRKQIAESEDNQTQS